MAREKLTAGRIRDFECPESGQSFLWDSEIPFLAVRATSGKKAFIYQGRFAGGKIRITIGDVRTWVIDGARQEARRLQSLIDQGVDPRLEKSDRLDASKARQTEAKRHEHTVGDAWQAYIDARRHTWGERHYKDHLTLSSPGGQQHKRGIGKPGPLAVLMPLKLADLTPERVEAWAKIEGLSRGARARLAFSLLRALVNWCEESSIYKGIIPQAACNSRIKRDHIPKMKSKDDCLQKEQLPAWFLAIRGLQNPVISAYFQALLLTGGRPGEILRLRWEDVDFRWQAMTIRDKVEGTRTIPLTPYLSFLLSGLPKRNNWVFSSPGAVSGRLEEPRRAHTKALSLVGIEGLTLHGLRRSFSTLSEWVESPVGVTAQIQGHAPSATAEKHYKKRPLDLLRMWHEKIEKWILDQAGIEQPVNGQTGLHLIKEA